jgi:hypothetical protein
VDVTGMKAATTDVTTDASRRGRGEVTV